MADTDFAVGAISSFLTKNGKDLPDQEVELESSSEEEEDEDFELRLQLALREHLAKQDGGGTSDWMAKYAAESDEEDDDGPEEEEQEEADDARDASAGQVPNLSEDAGGSDMACARMKGGRGQSYRKYLNLGRG